MALLACIVLKKFASHITDSHSLLIQSKYFENLSIGVLNLFDANEPDYKNEILILSPLELMNQRNSLELAVEGGVLKFLATSCIQNVLTKIWNGILSTEESTLLSFKVNINTN